MANHLPITFTTLLGKDVLRVARLRGREAISEPFYFEVDLHGEPLDEVPFEPLVGQPVTLTLRLSKTEVRHVSGIVSRFSEGEGDTEFSHFRAEIVPAFALLKHRIRSQVFTQQSVPEIVKNILGDVQATFILTRDYAPRPVCIQYRESDLAFASRLLEEEGIHYFFRHHATDHEMVVSDDPLNHPDLGSVNQVSTREAIREGPRTWRWEKSQAVTPGKWTLWDRTFQLPDQHLEGMASTPETASFGPTSHHLRGGFNRDLEVFEGTAGQASRFDGIGPDGAEQPHEIPKTFVEATRLARLRMEEGTVQALEARGQGDAIAFAPGHAFQLCRHRRADGKYLLTAVEHDAEQSGPQAGEGPAFRYENRFTAVPAATPFRPARRTPRPVVAGTMTARVVGPTGKDVFLDKHGRVKVQFHWDRHATGDGHSSYWIRVAQFWAGKRWGAFFWPRVGQEVVVAFEEGDPDRPIVVGSVYNQENVPPFDLPANDLVSGIKSCSVGTDANPITNFSGILFYDQEGQEHLEIHSEGEETSSTERSRAVRIGRQWTKVVGGMSVPSSGSGAGGGDNPLGSFHSVINFLPGRDLEFTVGERDFCTLGAAGYYVVGQNYRVSINPVAFSKFGGTAPIVGFQAALGGALGDVDLLVGSDANLHYGPTVNVHRGSVLQHTGPAGPLATALAAIAGGVTIAGQLASALQPDVVDPLVFSVGGKILQTATMAGLVSVEATLAWLQDAKTLAKVASDKADLLQRYSELLAQSATLKDLYTGKVAEIIAMNAEAAVGDAQTALLGGAPGYSVHDCNTYLLHVEKNAYLAAHGPDGLATVQILGDRVEFTAGESINAFAMKEIYLWGVEEVTLCGAEINLIGRDKRTPAKLSVTENAITARHATGGNLELDEKGALLKFSKVRTGPSVCITDTEITLAIGETTQLTLSPTGIELKCPKFTVNAEVLIQMKTALLETDAKVVSGKGLVQQYQ